MLKNSPNAKGPLPLPHNWARNKISCAHRSTNIFIRFATAVFATRGQSFVRLKIALDMWQGCELAYYYPPLVDLVKQEWRRGLYLYVTQSRVFAGPDLDGFKL